MCFAKLANEFLKEDADVAEFLPINPDSDDGFLGIVYFAVGDFGYEEVDESGSLCEFWLEDSILDFDRDGGDFLFYTEEHG